MCGLDDRPVMRRRQVRAHLDDVHARSGQFLGDARGVFGRIDPVRVDCRPRVRAGRAAPLNDEPAHEQPRPRDLAPRDPFAHVETLLERSTEIDDRSDAGHQELPGGDLYDSLHQAFLGRPFPQGRVLRPQVHQVRVQLDHPRHHHATSGVDHGGVGRNRGLGGAANPLDGVALDKHGRMVQRRHLVPVQQHPAHERQLLGRLRPQLR